VVDGNLPSLASSLSVVWVVRLRQIDSTLWEEHVTEVNELKLDKHQVNPIEFGILTIWKIKSTSVTVTTEIQSNNILSSIVNTINTQKLRTHSHTFFENFLMLHVHLLSIHINIISTTNVERSEIYKWRQMKTSNGYCSVLFSVYIYKNCRKCKCILPQTALILF